MKVTDDTTYVPDRWRQGSFETNVADAKKDVEINNLLAQADRFKTETIGPMMDRLR